MDAGEERKEEGQARVISVTDPEWLAGAEQTLLEVLEEYGEVSSNDVRAACGGPCDTNGSDRPNAMGAFMTRMKRSYGLTEVRREPARWPEQQGRPVPVYRRRP